MNALSSPNCHSQFSQTRFFAPIFNGVLPHRVILACPSLPYDDNLYTLMSVHFCRQYGQRIIQAGAHALIRLRFRTDTTSDSGASEFADSFRVRQVHKWVVPLGSPPDSNGIRTPARIDSGKLYPTARGVDLREIPANRNGDLVAKSIGVVSLAEKLYPLRQRKYLCLQVPANTGIP